MKNVIQFPVEKRVEQIAKEDELLEIAIENIESTCEEVMTVLVEDLLEYGYSVSDENLVIDISLLYEALKSILFKINELHHPMQSLAYTMYKDYVDGQEENPQLELEF